MAVPEEEERLTIRGLLRRSGYTIRIPWQGLEETAPRRELVEPVMPTPTPEPGEAVEEAVFPAKKAVLPIKEAEERRKKLDILVMRMARELRGEHGDLMLLGDFVTAVLDKFEEESKKTVSIDDVLTSIEELVRKGLIAGVMTLGSGTRVIRLSPEDFGVDELKVLDVVSRKEPPEITLEELMSEIGWPPARARAALKALERARVARYVPGSLTGGQDRWHFPGLEKKV